MPEPDKKSSLTKIFKDKAISILAGIIFIGVWVNIKSDLATYRAETKAEISSLRTAVNDIQQKITLIDPQTGKTISISEMFAILNNRVANVETMITKAANSLPEITSILIQIRDNAKGK